MVCHFKPQDDQAPTGKVLENYFLGGDTFIELWVEFELNSIEITNYISDILITECCIIKTLFVARELFA